MSDEITKEKRSRRLLKDETKAKRQKKILKSMGAQIDPFVSANYFNKKHSLNCGNPNCVMCGNPRKMFGDVTIQEKKFVEASEILE